MLWLRVVAISSLALTCGCGEDDPGGGGGGDGTATEGTESTTGTPATTTGISASGTTAADPTTSTTPAGSSSSSGVGDDSSTGPLPTRGDSGSTSEGGESSTGCALGTLDCGCNEGACDDGLRCSSDDVCGPPAVCDDDDAEPNETEDAATDLGEINDNDSNGASLSGVLDGEGDVDWFRYRGNDVAFQTVDPFRTISADAGVRFCKFALCDDGIDSTEFPCEGGAEAATSPDGAPGCCAASLIHVPDANCDGTIDDDMDIWIRVDQAEAACVPYTVNYHY